MILIIAEPFDMAALWLHARIAESGGMPAKVVTPAQLSYALSITQYLGSPHDDIAFRLANEETIRMRDVAAVINRIVTVPQAHINQAPEADRNYASSEIHAFMLGWLGALPCPVFNPPSPESLSGPWHSDIAALNFAVLAGFACTPATLGTGEGLKPFAADTASVDTHFVLDGQVIGALLDASARDAMIQFAQLWGTRLVQIDSCVREGRRHFVTASSMADYRRGGALLVRAILKAIQL